jgi:hypothetical protein
MTEPVTIYDPAIDERRPVTQKDIDDLQQFVISVQLRSQPIENTPMPVEGYSFDLACYPNRMRDDGYFVAEKKPIEAYEGLSGIDGKPVYPSVPKTPWTLRSQLPCDFAHELVRRWNALNANAR